MNSFIEDRFLEWLKILNLGDSLNPNIFVNQYNRYNELYISLISTLLEKMYTSIQSKVPNVDFFIKGRLKSKLSFLSKTFTRLVTNITSLLSDSPDNNASIEEFFGFIKEQDETKYNAISKKILDIKKSKLNIHPQKIQLFVTKVLPLLAKDEQDQLFSLLGKIHDIFAYRIVVRSVDYDIKDLKLSENGNVQIITPANSIIDINLPTKLSPEDIRTNKYGKNCASINGVETEITNHNLLYDSEISSRNRVLSNAKRDSEGKLTFLGDSILLCTRNPVLLDNIESIFYSEQNNSFYIQRNGKIINLTRCLAKGIQMKVRKSDPKTCIEFSRKIEQISVESLQEEEYTMLPNRRKDYILEPKQNSNYQSIHNSFVSIIYKILLESQIRTYDMEISTKEESEKTGHDNYKKAKKAKIISENPILKYVNEIFPNAFDSSSENIMYLLANHPEIKLSDVFPTYLLFTSTSKKEVLTLKTENPQNFDYFFSHVPKEIKAQIFEQYGINFDSFEAFTHSPVKPNSTNNKSVR